MNNQRNVCKLDFDRNTEIQLIVRASLPEEGRLLPLSLFDGNTVAVTATLEI